MSVKLLASKTSIVLFFILLGFNSFLYAGEIYQIDKFAATDKNIKLTTIEQLNNETKVSFKIMGPSNPCLFPPGHVNAFYITDVRKTKKWFLLDTNDAPLCPKRPKISQGSELTFTLSFEKVDVKRFHVIEGEQQSGHIDWYFPNIQLEK